MKLLDRLSLRQRVMLVILAVTIPVIVLELSFVIVNDTRMLKQNMQDNAVIIAKTVGGYAASDLFFDDEDAAKETLTGLLRTPSILHAHLYDTQGQLFASLHEEALTSEQSSTAFTTDNERQDYAAFVDSRLHVIKPVLYQGKNYGSIYLILSTQELDDKLLQYGAFLFFLSILSIVLAYFLASKLQRIISKPILDLAGTATELSQEFDYQRRVHHDSKDEIGRLYDAFNKMLERIEQKEADREIADQARKQSEDRLTYFFQATYEGVFFHEDGNILDVNPGISAIIGYTPKDLIGRNLLEFIAPKFRSDVERKMRTGIDNTYESEIVTINGTSVPVEIRARSVQVDGRHIRVVSVHNINERKQAALALQEAHDKLEEKVKERTRELAGTNSLLKQEIEERKKAELTSKKANRAKSTFLANMSHELRTPLNSIIGFTGIIKDGMAGDVNEEQARQLNMVYGSARHLLALINDILDLSKVEAGKVEVLMGKFELMSLLEEVKNLMQLQIDNRGIDFQLAGFIPEIIHTDRGKLRQVLLNLLGNAIKFTEQGNVTLVCQQRNRDVIFEVTDTGIGIGENNLRKIFDAFEQADDRTEREYEGTGLGLAISRQFIELLGGTISARSTLGHGSTFRIVLHDVLCDTVKKLPQLTEKNYLKTDIPKEKRKILVVDDDEKTRELLSFFLQDQGYTVITAANGEEALMLARNYSPFAITLDIMMPGQDGWEILGELKDDSTTQKIPVVVISILDEQNLGLSLGAVDYLTKPIDKKQLLNCMSKLNEQVSHVLVVDDSEKDAQLVRALLEPEGYNVRVAKDGAQGLAAIQEQQPDLLLLDLMMPGMSGFEVIRRLKSASATAHLPVIIVSAKSLTEAEAEYLRENTEGLLVKGQYSREDMLREVAESLHDLEEIG